MSDIEISVDNRQVIQAKKDIDALQRSLNTAFDSAQIFTKAFDRLDKANQFLATAAKANQELINKNLGVSNSYRSAAESAAIFEAAAKKESDAWFAQQRRRLAMMEESARLTQRTTGVFGRFGFAAQQAGYQVGDFFVQIQSGTNPLVAFGQQATQLAGLLTLSLNPAVMAWGVALSIVIPLVTALGAAWMRTNKDTEKSVDNISQHIKNLQVTIENLHLDNIKVGFKTDEASVAQVKEDLVKAQIEMATLQKATLESSAIAAYSGSQYAGPTALADLQNKEKIATQQEIIDNGNKILGQLEAEKEAQRMLNGGLSVAANMTATAIRDKQAELSAQKELVAAHAQQVQYMAATQIESEKFKQTVISAYNYMAQTRIASNIIDGWKEAEKLEDSFRKSYEYYGKTRQEAQLLVTAVNEALENGSADDFQKAMQDALDAGITFSGLDLASPVIRAMNAAGSLFGYLQAAMSPANTPFIPSSGLGLPSGRSGLAPRESIRPPGRNEATWNEYFGSASSGGGGGATENALEQLQKQLDLEKELLGTTEAYQRVRKALGDDFSKTQPEVINGLIAQIEKTEQLKQVEAERKQLMNSIESSMEEGFMAMVEGTKSVKDAFRDMARDIIKELYRVLVVQRIVSAISGAVGGAFPSAIAPTGVGAATPLSAPMPRMSPTPIARAMPAANTTVVQNINISGTGDGAYVRQEIAKAIPQITAATKSAVIDARRRGGQMAAAFQ